MTELGQPDRAVDHLQTINVIDLQKASRGSVDEVAVRPHLRLTSYLDDPLSQLVKGHRPLAGYVDAQGLLTRTDLRLSFPLPSASTRGALLLRRNGNGACHSRPFRCYWMVYLCPAENTMA